MLGATLFGVAFAAATGVVFEEGRPERRRHRFLRT
jgi:hypothetical protein